MLRYFNIFKLRRCEYINQIISVNLCLFISYSFVTHFFFIIPNYAIDETTLCTSFVKQFFLDFLCKT